MIKPTVGRMVYFYGGARSPIPHFCDIPLAAIIVAVLDDRLVNLSVHDYVGHVHPVTSCPLVQPNEAAKLGVTHCTWMPYQVGQAPSSQELLKIIDELKNRLSVVEARLSSEVRPLAGPSSPSLLPPPPLSTKVE